MFSHQIRLYGLFILHSLLFSTVHANCYYPNGTDRNAPGSNLYAPCNKDWAVSMCCVNYETCLPDGLCQATDQYGHGIWRESCTDSFWRSENCTKLCIDGTSADGQENEDHDALITQCSRDPNTYCCGVGFNSTLCCEQGNAFQITQGKAVSAKNSTTTSISSSSIATMTATATVTSTPHSSPDQTGSPHSSSNKTGPILGGVVGGLAALGLLAGAIWYILRKRNGISQKQEKHTEEIDSKEKYGVDDGALAMPRPELEVIAKSTPELDARHRVELGEGR